MVCDGILWQFETNSFVIWVIHYLSQGTCSWASPWIMFKIWWVIRICVFWVAGGGFCRQLCNEIPLKIMSQEEKCEAVWQTTKTSFFKAAAMNFSKAISYCFVAQTLTSVLQVHNLLPYLHTFWGIFAPVVPFYKVVPNLQCMAG